MFRTLASLVAFILFAIGSFSAPAMAQQAVPGSLVVMSSDAKAMTMKCPGINFALTRGTITINAPRECMALSGSYLVRNYTGDKCLALSFRGVRYMTQRQQLTYAQTVGVMVVSSTSTSTQRADFVNCLPPGSTGILFADGPGSGEITAEAYQVSFGRNDTFAYPIDGQGIVNVINGTGIATVSDPSTGGLITVPIVDSVIRSGSCLFTISGAGRPGADIFGGNCR